MAARKTFSAERILELALPYAVPAIGLFLVYNYLTKGTTKQQEDVDAVGGTPTKDGSTTSNISASNAANIATSQFDAMQGFGTNENILFNSLNGLNGKALQLVYQKFGLKPYLIAGYFPAWATGTNLDLFSWYRNELDTNELIQMRQVWAKSGLVL
jgi:hypothetical protein